LIAKRDLCRHCGWRWRQSRNGGLCEDCFHGRLPIPPIHPARKPGKVTHVAAYCPPKGYTAWALLGTLVTRR
jgi:hypothetical protein